MHAVSFGVTEAALDSALPVAVAEASVDCGPVAPGPGLSSLQLCGCSDLVADISLSPADGSLRQSWAPELRKLRKAGNASIKSI